MKKLLLFVLCVLMVASVFTGCGGSGDKGATIPVYFSDEILNFDPAFAYTDDAAAKIMPLLYEGLTRIDDAGKVQKALIDSYTYKQQDDGTYMMEITLKESYWNDGISVSANDFVYAFKRIMDPEFSSEAACLLYDLKDARDVKAGTKSIDDLGVRSADKSILQFIFSQDIDMDAWLETLASPALVPLREQIVTALKPQDIVYEEQTNNNGETTNVITEYDISAYAWSTDAQNLVTNGPFTVKSHTRPSRSENGEMVLERNNYYHRDPYGREKISKYVTPYRIKIVYASNEVKSNYTLGEGESQVNLRQLVALASMNADNEDEKIVFDSDLSLVPASKASKVKTVDMLTQHVYYFNTKNETLSKPEVRAALSLAVDREAICEIVNYTVPAKGFVQTGIYKDGKRKSEYRESYDDLIAANGNMDEARSMLRSAGVTRGSFTLSCRDSEVETAVAEYVKSVWEELGFTVTIRKLGMNNNGIESTEQTKFYSLYRDELVNAYVKGDFDVIAIDYTATSTYAFGALAPFAAGFTGQAIDLRERSLNENYDVNIPHITGWQNNRYDELIEQAFAEKDLAARSDLLYQAETILMEEMPVMPLFQYQNAYSKTGALSKLSTDYYGAVLFTKAKLK
ncbi:MAG: hypothetical protein HFE78_06615 [Clostridiales bacterium]|nr:hypothetical protein [Clostridiales bacterium]